MKKIMKLMFAMLMLMVSGLASVSATPLSMDYSITDIGGGTYQYDFTLTVDNNDGSWTSGDNFNWIIVGDCVSGCPSPLTDWAWLSTSDPSFIYSVSSGYHNGPTLIDSTPTVAEGGWYTYNVGDALYFSGTSTAYLGQGELLWSNLIKGSGDTSTLADQEIANLVNQVPEPGSLALLGLGLVGLGLMRRKA